MQAPFRTITLADTAATTALGHLCAPVLCPGDTLLLSGEIGAGKSTFARAVIQARLGRAEDVPSPTFTLVQTYEDSAGAIWHCDLYRLTDPEEVFELGLDEAFDTAICLIEWPDRLGSEAPSDALLLHFNAEQNSHRLTITGSERWRQRLEVIDD